LPIDIDIDIDIDFDKFDLQKQERFNLELFTTRKLLNENICLHFSYPTTPPKDLLLKQVMQ